MNGSPAPAPIPVGRRIFHLIAASATTLLALVMPEHAYMPLIGGGALLGLVLDCSRPRLSALNRLFLGIFRPILKQSETTEITGATWFLVAAFFTFYFFGPPVAIPVLMFVAVGDPAAALVGGPFPRSAPLEQIAGRRGGLRRRLPGVMGNPVRPWVWLLDLAGGDRSGNCRGRGVSPPCRPTTTSPSP